jgi:uncharacterized protein YcbX
MDGWKAVGRVAALYRHPIKSMAAQPLSCATVDRYGIAGDRRFALRRLGDGSGFPWLTASKLPALIRYAVCCASGDSPSGAAMHVHAPDGEFISCDGDAITRHFAERHGVDVELSHLEHGIFDLAGISVITTHTLASVGALVAKSMDARRFRPNLVIEVDTDDDSYPEDAWVGSSLAFGDPASGPRIAVTERDKRCVMINLDPDGGPASTTIHRIVVRERDNYAGVYAMPTHVGAIELGDVAFVRVE